MVLCSLCTLSEVIDTHFYVYTISSLKITMERCQMLWKTAIIILIHIWSNSIDLFTNVCLVSVYIIPGETPVISFSQTVAGAIQKQNNTRIGKQLVIQAIHVSFQIHAVSETERENMTSLKNQPIISCFVYVWTLYQYYTYYVFFLWMCASLS